MPFQSCEELLETARYRIAKELEKGYRDRDEHNCGLSFAKEDFTATGVFVQGPTGTSQVFDVASPGDARQLQSDGHRVFWLTQGTLKIIDVSSGTPKLSQVLGLGEPETFERGQVFAHGHQLLVIGEREQPDKFSPSEHKRPKLLVVRHIDASVPGQARIIQSWSVEGELVDVRQKDGVIRLLHQKEALSLDLRSAHYYFHSGCMREPDPDSGKIASDSGAHRDTHSPCKGPWAEALRNAKEHNAQVLAKLSPQDFVPSLKVEIGESGSGPPMMPLFACDELLKQQGPQGVGVLSLLSFDLSQADALQSKLGVFGAMGQTLLTDSSLYTAASIGNGGTSHVYLSLSGPREKSGHRGGELTQTRAPLVDHRCAWTYIDRFDLQAAEPNLQQSNARIQGSLSIRNAMSEHDGALRISALREASSEGGGLKNYLAKLLPVDGKLDIVQEWAMPSEYPEYVTTVTFMGDVAYYLSQRHGKRYFSIELSQTPSEVPLRALPAPGRAFSHLHAVAPQRLLTLGHRGAGFATGRETQLAVNLFDVGTPGANKLLHSRILSSDLRGRYEKPSIVAYSPERKRLAVLHSGWKEDEQGDDIPAREVVILSLDPQVGFEEVATIPWEKGADGKYDLVFRMTLLGETLWIHSSSYLKGYSIQTGEQTGSFGL